MEDNTLLSDPRSGITVIENVPFTKDASKSTSLFRVLPLHIFAIFPNFLGVTFFLVPDACKCAFFLVPYLSQSLDLTASFDYGQYFIMCFPPCFQHCVFKQ